MRSVRLEPTAKKSAGGRSRLQSTLEYLLKGDFTIAPFEIEVLAHDPSVTLAALCNGRQRV
jgi:Tfp pilus assembly protein PilF